jgi:hypothetical protein
MYIFVHGLFFFCYLSYLNLFVSLFLAFKVFSFLLTVNIFRLVFYSLFFVILSFFVNLLLIRVHPR